MLVELERARNQDTFFPKFYNHIVCGISGKFLQSVISAEQQGVKKNPFEKFYSKLRDIIPSIGAFKAHNVGVLNKQITEILSR